MRRFQLIQAIGLETQTALNTYTGDSPSRAVTDAVAADILGVLEQKLKIDGFSGLKHLPAGCVLIDRQGLVLTGGPDSWWDGYFSVDAKNISFPAWLIHSPEWTDRNA